MWKTTLCLSSILCHHRVNRKNWCCFITEPKNLLSIGFLGILLQWMIIRKWQTKYDLWQMTNNEWQITNNKWQMTNDKWQMTNDQQQRKNSDLFLVIWYLLFGVCYLLLVGFCMFFIICCLLFIICWLLLKPSNGFLLQHWTWKNISCIHQQQPTSLQYCSYSFKLNIIAQHKNTTIYRCTFIPDYLSLVIISFSRAVHPSGLFWEGFPAVADCAASAHAAKMFHGFNSSLSLLN